MNLSPTLKTWKRRLLYSPRRRDDRRGRMKTVATSLVLHLHPTRVPVSALRFTYTWGLGGISVLLALMLGLTGAMLMFRYEPAVDSAYSSIQQLETQVAFGSLIRAAHHWSANLLVITTFLHLVRVFLTGSYKRGRGLNWVIGVALLLIVLAFNFTGYLLPWDQLAYWAVTVSTSLISYIPLVGHELRAMVLAGSEVGQGALTNFYAVHVAVLPLLMAVTLGYHFWRIRHDGGISQPIDRSKPVQRVTTLPNLIQREFAVAAVVLCAVILWSMLVPAPLLDMANPMRSPNPAKAAWYFTGLQELLLHMDTLAAMALVVIVLAALVLLPRLDRKSQDIGLYFRSPAGRRAALLGFVLGIDLVPLMVLADEYWIDWPTMLPALPTLISTGLVPLVLTLLGLAAVYGLIRGALKADRSEGLVGLFSFVVTALIVLTIVGNFFRGANMALVLPW